MIIGIDVGASTIKAIAINGSQTLGTICVDKNLSKNIFPEILLQLINKAKLNLEEVVCIAATGGGSRFLPDELFDVPVIKVNEIQAIGIGGLTLLNADEGLIVSMGTGTALVVASKDRVYHVGGTGVGGGTLQGLAELMLGIREFKRLEALALTGNPKTIDLTVADIIGGPIGIIPADVTASNFGKISSEAQPEDIAAAIFNLVAQVIGVVTAFAARAYHLEDKVILIGKLASSKPIIKYLDEVAQIFGFNYRIPANPEYGVAIGAAKVVRTKLIAKPPTLN